MTDKTETVADVGASIRRSVEYIEKQYPGDWKLDADPILRNMRRWADRIERAMSVQQPTHWANPETGEAISDERKRALTTDYGTGGTKQAAGFSRPLYATPQPEPKPVEYDRVLIADMLHDAPIIGGKYSREAIAEQVRLLRAADNAEAAGVRTVRRESAAKASEKLIEAAELLNRSFEIKLSRDDRRELWSALGLPFGIFPNIDVIRAKAKERFRAALTAALQEGNSHDQ